MNAQQSLPCPECRTPIPFTIDALLSGASFTCSKCGSEVSLAPQSVDQARGVYEAYQALMTKTRKVKVR